MSYVYILHKLPCVNSVKCSEVETQFLDIKKLNFTYELSNNRQKNIPGIQWIGGCTDPGHVWRPKTPAPAKEWNHGHPAHSRTLHWLRNSSSFCQEIFRKFQTHTQTSATTGSSGWETSCVNGYLRNKVGRRSLRAMKLNDARGNCRDLF